MMFECSIPSKSKNDSYILSNCITFTLQTSRLDFSIIPITDSTAIPEITPKTATTAITSTKVKPLDLILFNLPALIQKIYYTPKLEELIKTQKPPPKKTPTIEQEPIQLTVYFTLLFSIIPSRYPNNSNLKPSSCKANSIVVFTNPIFSPTSYRLPSKSYANTL
jgi:hypothetical protein